MESYGTIWVCVDCLMHHANGECGSCNGLYGPHDEEPLSAIGDGFHVADGMGYADHSEDCLTHIIRSLQEKHPELDWPDVPGDYECDCETDSFSRSQCEGCGSYLHGERHAMTLFKADPRPPKPVELEDTPTLLRRLYDAARDV